MHHQRQFCLEVADISVKIDSADPTLQFETQGVMKDFLAAEDQPDGQASATWSDLSQMSLGRKIFDSGALWQLHRINGSYLYAFTSSAFGPVPYKVASFDPSFTSGEVSLHRPYFESKPALYPLEYPLDELWMVNLLGQGRGAEIHGCGVVDAQGKGHLFVGQSGAGKSTMARLWEPQKGIQILSDDRIVLRQADQKMWMYGTPWHGEAGFSSATRAPLSRIYFLRQAKENKLLPQRPAQAVGQLFTCSFPPSYNPEALDFTLGFFEKVVQAVPCFELRFLRDEKIIDVLTGLSHEE
jgi:hypothetical protein